MKDIETPGHVTGKVLPPTPNELASRQLLCVPTITDSRGHLSVVEPSAAAFPFAVERVFWIYGVPEGQSRGGHAHRTCQEVLIAVRGSVDVTLSFQGLSRTFRLCNPREGLLIRPNEWCQLEHFSPDCVCLCLASESYRSEGYIYSKTDEMR